MSNRERAYILRIAAIRETNEGPQGIANLARALRDIDSFWTEDAIDRAVAVVRGALDRMAFATVAMDIAA
ncbi:MAG TPA: hypothetical protein VNM70_01145 [Burkholderiales bacterium]|nr:hypothetical protein [Burkholderiales bacterium]